MALIYGVDPSKSTGVAIFDTDKPRSAIRVETLKIEGGLLGDLPKSISKNMYRLFRKHGKPDFMCIEQPILQNLGGVNSLIIANQIFGSLMGQCPMFGVNDAVLAPQSWRVALFESSSRRYLYERLLGSEAGRKRLNDIQIKMIHKAARGMNVDIDNASIGVPKLDQMSGNDKKTKDAWSAWWRQEWKRRAKDFCRDENVEIKNDDEADAVCIAVAASKTQAFRMMETQRMAA
ncbi:hypothetical protein [Ahrensia sp. R2A130]|uniref:hypothetical protein n=1 Tax=Ahrensia sp. R2A130 TaxID=744979 RepID=UPI0001E0BCB2|nr:hypothetical protein [Ahrensia sp. R2A130]EFL88314.1 hypothetical protein R2A130_3481 [Ahrensia sp. R2A130]